MRSNGFLILAAFLFVAGVCLGADGAGYRDFVAPDAVQGDLNGPVRLVKSQTFDETENGGQKLVRESSTLYDSKGYLQEDRDASLEDGEVSAAKRTYDDAGNLIEEEVTEGKQVVKKKIRLAPERKRVFWDTESGGGKSVLSEEMTFDRFGKEGEGREYDAKGNVSEQYRTRRDANGKEVEITFADATGKPESVIKAAWDARGFQTSSELDDKKEKFTVKTVNVYPDVDAQGNWLRRISTNEYLEGGRKVGSAKSIVVRTIEYY